MCPAVLQLSLSEAASQFWLGSLTLAANVAAGHKRSARLSLMPQPLEQLP